MSKFEYIQCNTVLFITGAINGTSLIRLYNELDLKSLKFRRGFKKLCLFYKLKLV